MCADDPGCCNDPEDMVKSEYRCETCGEYDCPMAPDPYGECRCIQSMQGCPVHDVRHIEVSTDFGNVTYCLRTPHVAGPSTSRFVRVGA